MTPYSYSNRLQRVLCDFAWENSFSGAKRQLKEHYGFELPTERIRQNALKHAKIIEAKQSDRPAVCSLDSDGVDQIIAQADGCMIRLLEYRKDNKGKQKKELSWNECRLAAVNVQGENNATYAASFNGVEDIGIRWGQCAKDAGWGTKSNIHCVADGAPWIEDQSLINFGPDRVFLIDLFHVCEYLAEASHSCVKKETPMRWFKRHKNMLKKGNIEKVIENLKAHVEVNSVEDKEAPVRRALRYIQNRSHALDYPTAIEKDLPIGSGLIESGHKHVLQKRLKGAGMAWLQPNAQAMAQARCLIASGNWEQYWSKKAA